MLGALGTASVAYARAASPKLSGDELARGVTATIIRATIFVLFVQLVFAMIEF